MNNLRFKLKRNFTNIAGERLYINDIVNIKDIFVNESKTIMKCTIEKDGTEIIVNMKDLLK